MLVSPAAGGIRCFILSQFRHFSKSRLPLITTDPFHPNVNEVIDVRTLKEFKEDHIPGAVNLPVLSDLERHEVGKLYSQDSFKGRIYGAELVTKNISQMIHEYLIKKPKEYSPLVYCWRGGQRSYSVAVVMAQIGFDVYVLEKGYKTYRERVKECLNEMPGKFTYKVLSGPTGSGKTFLLSKLSALGEQVLDLEGIANHKGSVLGAEINGTQPSQKWFESQIVEKLRSFNLEKVVWVESESVRIGNVHVPQTLHKEMGKAQHFRINLPMEKRVQHILKNYPDYIENFQFTKQKLMKLKSYHSNSKLSEWISLGESGQWTQFVEAFLTEHYDPSYSLSQSKNFKSPATDIYLDSLDPEHVQSFLHTLISDPVDGALSEVKDKMSAETHDLF
ncbi:tRNA 2-selenouridine synthase-like isoform X2 [Saccostrea cucullata]